MGQLGELSLAKPEIEFIKRLFRTKANYFAGVLVKKNW